MATTCCINRSQLSLRIVCLLICRFSIVLLINPVVQAQFISRYLDGIELHPRSYVNQRGSIKHPSESLTENGLILPILPFRVGSYYGAKVVVINLLLICHHELPPPFLAGFALHLVFINCSRRVELGEIFLQMLVYFVIQLSESEG